MADSIPETTNTMALYAQPASKEAEAQRSRQPVPEVSDDVEENAGPTPARATPEAKELRMALAHQMTAATDRAATLRVLAPRKEAAAVPMPTSDEDWTATLLAMPMPAEDAPLPIRLAWRYVRLAECQQKAVDVEYVEYIDGLYARGRLEPDMTMDQAIAEGRFRVEPLPEHIWPYFDISPNYDHPCYPPVRPRDTYEL